MKALCVKPEFAEMIASGEKDIEYRTWKTNYRGELLIVATQPVGKAVAVCKLVDCVQNDDGEWEWMLENARRIEPFPVKGKLGLFEVEPPKGSPVFLTNKQVQSLIPFPPVKVRKGMDRKANRKVVNGKAAFALYERLQFCAAIVGPELLNMEVMEDAATGKGYLFQAYQAPGVTECPTCGAVNYLTEGNLQLVSVHEDWDLALSDAYLIVCDRLAA